MPGKTGGRDTEAILSSVRSIVAMPGAAEQLLTAMIAIQAIKAIIVIDSYDNYYSYNSYSRHARCRIERKPFTAYGASRMHGTDIFCSTANIFNYPKLV